MAHVPELPLRRFSYTMSCRDDRADQSHGRAMEGLAMSLSAWEQQALDSIKDGLAGSDPQLAALLTTFTRLASTEDMPVQETIPAGSRRARRMLGMLGRVNLRWAMLLLWLVITAVMITVALTLSHNGSQATCAGSWPTACSHSASG